MQVTPEKARGNKTDWFADRVIRGLLRAVLQLPYEKRVAFMGALTERFIGPSFGYRKRAIANLEMIYPSWTPKKRANVAGDVCNNFGRTLIENYSNKEFGDFIRRAPILGDGLAHIHDAKKVGRPVIFVTGHFGNHEAARHRLTQIGFEVGGLYRKMGNPYFNDHYAQTMTSWGGPVFEQGKRGTMGFARHIKSGKMGTLLFDVNQNAGQPIPFLGKPALTPISAAEIALKFDALVIPYFGIRQADGLTFNIEVDTPIVHSDPIQMTVDMTQALEKRIELYPEQWFWVHRRWKIKD